MGEGWGGVALTILGLLSNQLHIVKKESQCLINSTHRTLTSILSNISIRFSSITPEVAISKVFFTAAAVFGHIVAA